MRFTIGMLEEGYAPTKQSDNLKLNGPNKVVYYKAYEDKDMILETNDTCLEEV